MDLTTGLRSDKTYQALCEVFPRGVNSPFRAFDLVGGRPPVLVKGAGSRVWDQDGREYLDLCCAWGPLVLGHAHPAVVEAACAAVRDGALFGAPTPWELELGELLRDLLPSMEMMRLVNSGAEAVMSALRVARAATGRPRVLKFQGCYHGHVECLDALDARVPPLGTGASPGAASETVLAVFNDLESVERALDEEVAAVIVEPVTGSMGVIEPADGFLSGLRELCDRNGSLLIFDEVLTGFRVSLGGAQERYSVRPDLTCLGKALGGGFAVGAYGGRRELMANLAPRGPVYQAGTFSGNPVTVRAAIAALTLYRQPGLLEGIEGLARRLAEGWRSLGLVVGQVGSMFSVGFGVEGLRDHRDAERLDTERFAKFFHGLLSRGVYLPPSCHDAACLSAAHTEDDVDRVLALSAQVLAAM